MVSLDRYNVLDIAGKYLFYILKSSSYLGFPAKLVSFRISRNTKRNKFCVSRNKLAVSRNFALNRNKQFRMFRSFLNETKQPVSHVLYQLFSNFVLHKDTFLL
jgi:hypothetical protein